MSKSKDNLVVPVIDRFGVGSRISPMVVLYRSKASGRILLVNEQTKQIAEVDPIESELMAGGSI